ETVQGDLTVNGNTTLGDAATDTVNTSGDLTVGGNETVTGNETVQGDLTVNGNTTLGTGGTPIVTHLSATESIIFPDIPANSTEDQPITVTGAAPGDNVYVSPAADPGAGLVWSAFVSAANTVTIRLANVTTAVITPNVTDWRADVWKH
ncbi:hypothetical protein SAMN05216352_12633, partial [Alteribacillus bidgolensis]